MNKNSKPHPLLSDFYPEMDTPVTSFPDDITVFIPTYGRVGEQVTIHEFPKETWGVNVFLVASADEDHGDLPVIVSPPEINSIAKKRHWIMEYARDNNLKKVVVADDNIMMYGRSYTLDPKVATLVKFETDEQFYQPWQFLSNRLEEFHVFQFKDRFFGQKAAQIAKSVAGGGSFYAYRVDTYFDIGIDCSHLPIYEDIHIMLEYAKAGYDFIVYGDIAVQKKKFTTGGNRKVPEYSQKEAYVKALEDFVKIHPEWARVVELKKPYDNRPTNHACKFNFRKLRDYIEDFHAPDPISIFDIV